MVGVREVEVALCLILGNGRGAPTKVGVREVEVAFCLILGNGRARLQPWWG